MKRILNSVLSTIDVGRPNARLFRIQRNTCIEVQKNCLVDLISNHEFHFVLSFLLVTFYFYLPQL